MHWIKRLYSQADIFTVHAALWPVNISKSERFGLIENVFQVKGPCGMQMFLSFRHLPIPKTPPDYSYVEMDHWG
ncbi:MAG: hypothetical protein WBN56_12815, partial [Robiginitalea sp.]|uniref:hypothetical protein n=1 Tax=Robiginitalea sp. TaxID=1902411 RepID=UPI003C752916